MPSLLDIPHLYRSKFAIDLNVREGHQGHTTLLQCEKPVGYQSLVQQERQQTGASRPTLTVAQQNALAAKRKSKAMSIATNPGKQIMMNAFMMYMSGSQLNIFSISITSGAILTPLSNLFGGMEQQFAALQGDVDLTTPKLIFVALNLVWLGVGLYKMSSMRLLPTTSADYAYKILWKDMMERTSIPPADNMIL